MSKPSRRPTRRHRHRDLDPRRPEAPAATSEHGFLNRQERRFAKAIGFVGERESPIPCLCVNGHAWCAPGFFQAGVGTFFDDGDDRWCRICGEPEEFSQHLPKKEIP